MLQRLFLAAAVVSCVALPAVQAQLVIDVNQPLHQGAPYIDSETTQAGFGPLLQQSFKPLASNIAGGGFFWHQIPGGFVVACDPTCHGVPVPAAEVEISLFSEHSPLGTLGRLAQTHVFFDPINPAQWVDAFWDPVSVTPGETYYLGIRAILATGLSGPGFKVDTYAGGYAHQGTTSLGYFPGYEPFYDFTFRTWTTAPEPSTYALTAAGLLALGIAARRRRTC